MSAFLLEACIPPVPIARMTFFKDAIDKHYHNLSAEERTRILEWMRRTYKWNTEVEEIAMFEARYDSDNQYLITVSNGEVEETRECFLFKGEYRTNSKGFAPKKINNQNRKIMTAEEFYKENTSNMRELWNLNDNQKEYIYKLMEDYRNYNKLTKCENCEEEVDMIVLDVMCPACKC